MLKIENVEIAGWRPTIRGMRNPKNSWDRIDSEFLEMSGNHDTPISLLENVGPNDHGLMMNLAKGGPVHAKYRRMITVWFDVTAPMFWWKEFDTYKVGTVRNSCSTMHKIHVKPFTIDDFSHEGCDEVMFAKSALLGLIETLEHLRVAFNNTQEKRYWRALIELLPSNYNMKATICTNYEVLGHIRFDRKGHKVDEWHTFCDWVESLPYSEIMTQKVVGIE
jgi:hypothetical protein